eukprot:gb/GFBE01061180.1/.p1 GENE.gb/GFBE01061180.1/~~gb/GFBE01061180.1/.p1  ORF type:complete len:262 (+),score=52.27 gb/GFBE01061180.1/:1-786(+)
MMMTRRTVLTALLAVVSPALAGASMSDERMPSALAADDACDTQQGNALLQTQGVQRGKGPASSSSSPAAATAVDVQSKEQGSEAAPNVTEFVRMVDALFLLAAQSNSTVNAKSDAAQDSEDAGANKSLLQFGPFAPSPPSPAPAGTSCGFPRSMHVCNMPVPKNVMCVQSCALMSWMVLDMFCHKESAGLFGGEGHVSEPGSCDSSYSCPVSIKELEQFSSLDPMITEIGASVMEANGLEFLAMSLPLIGCSISSIAMAFR